MDFRILGPLEVSEEDRPLPVPGAKERALLALLLLNAGQVVSSDRLIDELWGEEPPRSARKSLQVRVANLRRVLGRERIRSRPPGYVLSVERGELDLHRFEQLVAEGGPERLREALLLWRGPALADFAYEAWAGGAIARLEELRLAALELRIDADLELGRHRELVGELDAYVREHPLRERLRAQLMLALYRSGRQADALRAYRATRQALVEELGIEPSLALQELERAILRHDPSLELAQAALERSILVVCLDATNLDALLEVAQPLAQRPRRELILTSPISPRAELAAASAHLHHRCRQLLAEGTAARAAAFTSAAPGSDTARLAAEQDVDLLLVDGPAALLDDRVLADLLADAPCDVAVLVGRGSRAGPVLVPFADTEHDWSAIEIGAWLARAQGSPLRLAGPRESGRDPGRMLASASLAVQRALGVAAEPLVVEPGPDGLIRAADGATLVVAGLSDRWRRDGLGPVRAALVSAARTPVVLVRRGLRPGGLAPPDQRTRFTWTLRAG